MTSSGALPLEAAQGSKEPHVSPALNDDPQAAYLGRARIKDVEAKLGALIHQHCTTHVLTWCIDTIQGLVQRLVESNKQRAQDIVTRRKRHKRDTRLTAEVLLRQLKLT